MGRSTVRFQFLMGAVTLVAALGVPRLGGQVLPSAGGQTPQPAQTGLLIGQVVDGLSDRPVGGTLVTLMGRVGGTTDVVLTDAQGRFVFEGLKKNAYTISASKPGYLDGEYGQRRASGAGTTLQLADGEHVGDVKVPIWKYASITGTITDEAGEPMIDLRVRVLARSIVAGRRKLTPGAIAKTDDRGVYWIGRLPPGEYVIAAISTQATAPEAVVDLFRQSRQSPASMSGDQQNDLRALTTPSLMLAGNSGAVRVGDLLFQSTAANVRVGMSSTIAADGRVSVYPAQYYSAAAAPAQAVPIALRPGEERSGINLQLRLVPTVRVSGIVTGPDGPLMTNLALVSSGQELSSDAGLETATSVSDAAGRFTFLGVPAGQYVLRVMKGAPAPSRGAPPPSIPPGPTLWASQPLPVGTDDISGLSVTLRAGFRVSGTTVFDDPAQQPRPEVVQRIVATLESVDGRPPDVPTRAFFNNAGEFSSYELVPGRYCLRALLPPAGWTLKSAMLDGRDISNVPVTVDRPLTGVVITFTRRPSEVTGRVQNAVGGADATTTIVIFPQDNAAWLDYGITPRRLQMMRAERDGTFRFVGVPAGNYLVIAIPDESASDVFDPGVLQTLARSATPISLADGETRSLSLKTVVVSR
jgi:hypothetical protein